MAKKKPTKLTDHGKQLLPRALISNVIVFCDKERIKQASNETVANNFWKYLLSNSDRYIYIYIYIYIYNSENKPRGLYFSKALFEGLIFGGAYLRREICVSKSNGLALYLEVNLPFLLCFTLYLRAISKYKPPGGAYISRGDLKKGSLRYEFGGLIFGGAYTWRGLFSEFYGMRF